MEQTVLVKLVVEVRQFHNRDFLKAAMAVCALAAVADNEVKLSERYQIDAILAKEPALLAFDANKATDTLYAYIHALQTDWRSAADVLYKKIRRMAGNHKRARTLMRAAYLVIAADGEINSRERAEFWRICDMLKLDPREVLP
jgi:tellurite resistance protein TerB